MDVPIKYVTLTSTPIVSSSRDKWKKVLVWLSLFLLGADFIYRTIFGITFANRQICALYAGLPRWEFLIIENIVELLLVVIAGIFVAAIFEKHLSRFKRIIPGNVFTSFIYASVIPVCSCSAIPLIKPMRERVPFHVILTFIIAAPILNPYIIVLSLSLLGIQYTILRVIGSFVIASSVAIITAHFARNQNYIDNSIMSGCRSAQNCTGTGMNVYDMTYRVLKTIFPYLLIAGVLSILFESNVSRDILKQGSFGNAYVSIGVAIIIGIPLYMCNGADLLFLQPLLQSGHLPLGAAIAFSLTSTAVCISSLALISKYIGKRLTLIMLIGMAITAFLIGLTIQIIVP